MILINTITQYLGKQSEHIVFEADLIGTILAAKPTEEEMVERGASILLDTQATIMTMREEKRMTGQRLVIELHDAVQRSNRWTRHGNEAVMHSITGYKGILGNEKAG